MTAPAAMPSEEDVARAIRGARLRAMNAPPIYVMFNDDAPAEDADLASARAILDLFAPILAEKQKPTVALNHWKARALAAEAAVWELTDAKQKVYLIGVDHAERRAAAEAALAAERERCIAIVDAQVPDWVKERSGPYWEGYRDAMEDAAEDMRKGPRCG